MTISVLVLGLTLSDVLSILGLFRKILSFSVVYNSSSNESFINSISFSYFLLVLLDDDSTKLKNNLELYGYN